MRKTITKKSWKFFERLAVTGTAAFFALSALTSCQVGLGQAVDTEPPTLSVLSPNPSNKYIIRDAFTIKGECSDDTGLKDIVVILEHNITHKSVSFTAELDQNQKNWVCPVNPLDEKNRLPDGRYTCTVEANDTAGRKTSASLSFDIDNTPPVVVLTRPSTKIGSQSPDTFGQSFSISGQVADDSNIDQILVKVYSSPDLNPESLVETIPLKNVPPTMDLTVAEFNSEDGLYKKIYGEDQNAGKKQYYYSLVATDSARRLEDTSDIGNAVDYYFLYNDIYSNVLSKCNVATLYSIMNGSFTGTFGEAGDASRAVTSDDLKSELEKSQLTAGTFALNPLNNPGYAINGYEPLLKSEKGDYNFNDEGHKIQNGSKITVKVSSGLDNIPLINDTLAVYAYKCDTNGTKSGENPIVLYPAYKDKDGNVLITDEKEIAARSAKLTEVGSYDRNIALELNKTSGLEVGKYYLIEAKGFDEKKNDVNNNGTLFGMYFASNGAVPSLTAEFFLEGKTAAENAGLMYLGNEKSITVKGSVSHEEFTATNRPKVSIKINDTVVSANVGLTQKNAETFDYAYVISGSSFEENKSNSITVTTTYEGVENYVKGTVLYDTVAPKLTVSPINFKRDLGKKVNGNISIGGTIEEANEIVASAYKISDSTGKVIAEGNLDNSLSFNISDIDTTKGTDKKFLNIEVIATDRAGNTGKITNSEYQIDQSTDLPLIVINGLKVSNGAESTDPYYDENSFVKGATIQGDVVEDDGLYSVVVTVKDANNHIVIKSGADTNCNGSPSQTISQALKYTVDTVGNTAVVNGSSIGEDMYEIIVEAKDIYGNSSEWKTYFSVSGDVPTLTITEGNDKFLKTGDKVTFAGKVSGASKETSPLRIEFKYPNETENNGWKTVWTDQDFASKASKEWLKELSYDDIVLSGSADGSEYKGLFRAVAGRNQTEAEFTFNIDNTKPSDLTVSVPDKEDTKRSSYTFMGTAKDEGSGVSKVELKVLGNGKEITPEVKGTESWSSKIDFGSEDFKDVFEAEGEKTVEITVKDAVGNVSETLRSSFVYDKENPFVKVSDYPEVLSSSGGILSIEAKDSYKLKNIEIKQTYRNLSGSEITTTFNVSDSTTEKSISQVIPFDASGEKVAVQKGTYKYIVKVSDAVDNEKESNPIEVESDLEPPEIEDISISPVVDVEGVEKVNGIISVSLVLKDDRKLGNTLLWNCVTQDGTVVTGGAVNITGTTYQSVKLDVDTTVLPDNVISNLVFKVKDDIGYETNKVQKLNVDQSTDIPHYTTSNATSSKAEENLFGMGNWVINGTVTDDDGITKVEISLDNDDFVTQFEASKDNDGNYKDTKTSQAFNYKIDSIGEGKHELLVKVTDKNGRANIDEVLFAIDKNAPVITPEKVNGTTYSSGMFVQKNFDVILKASDSNKVAKVVYNDGSAEGVELTRVKTDGTAYTQEELSKETVIPETVYYKHSLKGETDGNGKSKTYRVTDSYGRTGETTINYNVDTAAPTVTTRDFITVSGKKIDDGLNSHWFRSEVITIKGVDGAVKDTNLSSTVHVEITGDTVTSSSFDLTPVTVPEDGENAAYIKGTFDVTLPINNGTSNIKLVFSDKAGNKTERVISVRADNKAPELKSPSMFFDGSEVSSGRVINPTSDKKINIDFIAFDAMSGLSKAYINTASSGTETEVSYEPKEKDENGNVVNNEYTIDYDASSLQDGQKELFLILEDAAGNKMAAASLGSFIIDRTAPQVTFDAVADADGNSSNGIQVNKTITISGSVTDANLAADAKPVLYIDSKKTAETGVIATRDAQSNKWTISGINTGNLSDNSDHTFKVCFTDKAGNVTSTNNVLTLNVKQDTDKPEITLKNIRTGGKDANLLKQKTVSGSIKDDDGAVKGMWYIESSDYNTAEGSKTVSPTVNQNGTLSDGDWKRISVSDNSWEIEADTASEGEHTWYFYVIDGNGTAFVTTTGTDLSCPKVKFRDGASFADNTTGINFLFDTVPPVIESFQVARKATATTSQAVSASFPLDTDWVNDDGIYFGGSFNVLYAKVVVREEVEMNATPLTLSPFSLTDDNCKLVATDSANHTFTYYMGPFVLDSSMPDGQRTLTLQAKDKADGRSDNKTKSINVDNAGCSLTVTAPSETTRITSTVTWGGTYQDNVGGSGTKSIKWMIPKAGFTPTVSTKEGWTDLSGTVSWNIPFTSIESDDLRNPLTYGDEAKYNVTSLGDNVFDVPVYFLMEDKLENKSLEYRTMRVDLDGGKPTAEIISPADGDSIGGRLRVYGSASDMDGTISEVHIQMDFDGDHDFDEADYEIVKVWADTGKVPYAGNLVARGKNGDWYINVPNAGESWSLTLNQTKELDDYAVTETEKNKSISIRVRAYDNGGNTRGWYGAGIAASNKYTDFHVNKNKPTISNLYLKQYDGETETASIPYTAGSSVWLSNEWFLEGDVKHASGIANITIDGTSGYGKYNASWESSAELPSSISAASGSESPFILTALEGRDGYHFKLQVSEEWADGQGRIKADITAQETSRTYTGEAVIEFHIDNEAPAMYSVNGAEIKTNEATTAGLRLKSDNEVLGDSKGLTQSNYTFNLGDMIRDTGSGFDKLAFYFERKLNDGENNAVVQRIYDPMLKLADSRVNVTGSEKDTKKLYINSENLPAYRISGKVQGAKFKPNSAADVMGNAHIRKGGLVKINGAYYTIDGITSGAVTLKSKDSSGNYVPASWDDTEVSASADFIYAQVVDHLVTSETLDTGLDSNGNLNMISGTDDGDNMMEYAQANGSTYTWSASINSAHIADGPINIHVVAFDRAGNISHAYVTTSVQNNRPRLANVYLATDINGNGKFDYTSDTSGEFRKYSALNENGKTVYAASIQSESFTAKDKLLILPEFVNDSEEVTGNGQMNYKMTVAEKSAADIYNAETGTATGNSKDVFALTSKQAIESLVNEAGKVKISEKGGMYFDNSSDNALYKADGSLDGDKKLQISFWDSTEGLIVGQTTQWAVLNIPLTVDFVDSVPPHGYIAPFFWDGSEHNSLYENKRTNGHIELSEDVTFDDKIATGSTKWGKDAKVSGKIVLRGFAYDDKRLGSISVSFAGKTVGTVSYTSSGWGTPSVTAANGGISMNVYSELPAGASLSDFGAASAPYQTLSGHKAFWEMAIDTEKFAGKAGLDKALTVTVTDAAGGKAEFADGKSGTAYTEVESGADESKNRQSFNVDVVPYMTEVSSEKTYYRSMFGGYSVSKGDTITVKGFNLGDPDVSVVKIGANQTVTPNGGGDDYFTFIAPEYSGELYVTVSGVHSINDLNNNSKVYNQETKESDATTVGYTGYYDNRYIYVWDKGHSFKSADDNAHKPVMTSDYDGNLFAAWTLMGAGQQHIERGLTSNSVRVMQHYDQPNEYSAIGVDKSKTSGGISSFVINENVGDGGIMSNNGFSQVSNCGGAWGISINNALTVDQTKGPKSSSPKITNNPFTTLDGNWGTSGYSLSSYAMLRDSGKFTTPRTVRYGNNMHYVYYNSQNQTLRYTYVASGPSSAEYARNENTTTENWIVLDGNNSGYDRLHDATAATGNLDLVGKAPASSTAKSVTLNDVGAWKSKIATGKDISVALAYTSNNVNKIVCYDVTGVRWNGNNVTLSFAETYEGGTTKPDSVTVYTGGRSVANGSGSATQSTNAGKFASLDLTSDGKPVVVYYDGKNSSLRIAYANKTNPTGTGDWVRKDVVYGTNKKATGGSHCSVKVDTSGNVHIIYRDKANNLAYIKGTGSVASGFTFSEPEIIDNSTTGTYGTLSLINGTVPAVAYLNAEESETGVKYAVRKEVDFTAANATHAEGGKNYAWDVMVVPVTDGYNPVGENLISCESNNGNWSVSDDKVALKDVSSVVAYQSTRFDVAFLKAEKPAGN